MLRATRVVYTAATLLKAAPSSSAVAAAAAAAELHKAPTPRRATAPSRPEQWQRIVKHRQPPAAPALSAPTPLRLPKPPFVSLENPARLALAANGTDGESQITVESDGTSTSATSKAYRMAQGLARRVAREASTELLTDTYPRLQPEGFKGAQELLLGDAAMQLLSEHYKLHDLVPEMHAPADEPEAAARLFRSYLASLHAQEGERFAHQWIRQCLRSLLNDDYSNLREQQKAAARLARGKEILSPLSHLRNFLRHRPELKPVWTIAVRGEREEYRAEVSALGLQASGTARSIRMAKQNAAEKLMELVWRGATPEELDPGLPDYPKILTLWAGQSQRSKPSFDCQVEKAPVVRCTLVVEGEQFVERGLSKRAARFLAAKGAIEELGIDTESVRLEPLRRPSQARRRAKFQELLAARKAASLTERAEEGTTANSPPGPAVDPGQGASKDTRQAEVAKIS